MSMYYVGLNRIKLGKIGLIVFSVICFEQCLEILNLHFSHKLENVADHAFLIFVIKTLFNTPGTMVGPGGCAQTLAIKSRKKH